LWVRRCSVSPDPRFGLFSRQCSLQPAECRPRVSAPFGNLDRAPAVSGLDRGRQVREAICSEVGGGRGRSGDGAFGVVNDALGITDGVSRFTS
jgi:hypothetical protein